MLEEAQCIRMFTFEYFFKEEKIENQELTTENSSLELSLENAVPELSPAQKKTHDDEKAQNANLDDAEFSSDHEVTNQSAKTEKGSDEGFCCVMSMFDGVVL